jgi:hypothetical protein
MSQTGPAASFSYYYEMMHVGLHQDMVDGAHPTHATENRKLNTVLQSFSSTL